MKVNEEFKRLIPALTVEEYKQLEANILSEGIRDPLVVWNGYLVDGHNRYTIATQHGLEYKTVNKEFKDGNAVKIWMVNNQLGRRNLQDFVRGELMQTLEELQRQKGVEVKAEKVSHFRQTGEVLSTIDNTSKHNTRQIVAEKLGWSTGKKAQFDVVAKKAPEEVKAQLRTGEMSINQAYKDIKKEEKKENYETKKKEFEKPITPERSSQQMIIQGDSRLELGNLESRSIDLLLTDPPYGMDFKSGWNDKDKIANDKIGDTITLLDDVLFECARVLKDDAHFYIFGNIKYITEVKPIIEKHLKLKQVLIWDREVIGMGDLKAYGNSFDIVYFGFNKTYKELNGTRERDILRFNRIDPGKNIHPTEKPTSILEYMIKKSSNEDDIILDPFAGGGSTLIASKNLNRNAIGIELEENYVDLILERL